MESLTQSINREIAERLETDDEFLRDYIRTWASHDVASELRNLRMLRKKRQADVAALVNTGQSAISRIEKAEYDGWSYKTLVAIALALRARLSFRLEPIEDVVQGLKGVNPDDPAMEMGVADTTKADREFTAWSTDSPLWINSDETMSTEMFKSEAVDTVN